MTQMITAAEAQRLIAERHWWYHKFEIMPGVWTPGVYDVRDAFENLHLPAKMTGMTVLEIGPSDGAFTKLMWERGARVTAVDYTDATNFDLMLRLSGCNARWLQSNALHIAQLNLGTFDVVLNMGVLYHLPDPLRALWLMRQHLRQDSLFILETRISQNDRAGSIMEYHPRNTLNNDETNFWSPNAQCCRDMLFDCGLIVESEVIGGERGLFRARLSPAPGADNKAILGYSA